MTSLSFSSAARRLGRAACLSAVMAGCAFAGIVTYTGQDLNPIPGNTPNSNTAAANFVTAITGIGNMNTISFESAPLGSFTSLQVAPGVTASGASGILSIDNTPHAPGSPAVDGFNTTFAGSQYIEDLAGSVTFTFATPIQFFGAFLIGVQSNLFQDIITFNDGSSQTLNANEAGTGPSVGAVTFLGFADVGKSIASITITAGNGVTGDFIGVDDVRYQIATVTPEPGTFNLVGVAAGALFGLRRLRRA
jgi:hypothetical protein